MMENTKASAEVNAEAEVTAEAGVETEAAVEVDTDVTAESGTDAATEVGTGAATETVAEIETEAAAGADTETAVEVSAKETATEVLLQYRGYEMNMADVTNRVKGHYMSKGFTEDSIENMQIYVKPEDFTAYYVINDGIVGKVNLF